MQILYQPGKIVLSKYTILKFLCNGYFSSVFIVIQQKQTQTPTQYVMKVVKSNTKNHDLKQQAQTINQLKNCPGILQIIQFGTQNGYDHLIMQMAQRTLQDLKKSNLKQKVEHKLVLQLAMQMIQIVRNIHCKNIIHRDIKPENFVIKPINQGQYQLFLIDFGLKKIYIENNRHIQNRKNRSPCGTIQYCSLNSLKGNTLSRRDDLQQMVNTLLYLVRGDLPWGYSKDKNQQIKLRQNIQNICHNIPPVYKKLLQYVRNLQFQQIPNYQKLLQMIKQEQQEQHKQDKVFNQIQNIVYPKNIQTK